MTLQLTRICVCTGEHGLGVAPGLVKAVEKRRESLILDGDETAHNMLADAAASWFRKQYDEAREKGCHVVEFQPLGRNNRSDGQWAWPTRSEWDSVYMAGFHKFANDVPGIVRASFGCPRRRLLGTDARDFHRLPVCRIQFDDVASRAPQVTRWLRRHGRTDAMLETVPTDRPDLPGLATRFVLPEGFEACEWRVRWRIVEKWIRRREYDNEITPFSSLSIGGTSYVQLYYCDGAWDRSIRLNILIPAADAETLDISDLRRVLPLLSGVSLQGPVREDVEQEVLRTAALIQ